ncbi:MAG: hypothetical protein U9Q80_01920 [Bacillota bacterium]|nr:hypothetical protein [Bacillota bacterium]
MRMISNLERGTEGMKKSRLIRRVGIVFILLLLIFSGWVVTKAMNKTVVSTSLAFYHDGIEKGFDPRGSKFDIYAIKEESFLSNVIEEVGLDGVIEPDQLALEISINPVVPNEILKEMKTVNIKSDDKTKRIEVKGYNPNEYVIGIKNELGLSNEEMENLLSTLVSSYTASYYERYFTIRSTRFDLDVVSLLSYDYPDMVAALDSEIAVLVNYIGSFKSRDAFYRGLDENISFGDLEQKVLLLKSIDLKKLISLIGAYRFTKDQDERIELLNYKIELESNYKDKKNDEKEVISSIIDKYKKNTALLFLGNEQAPVELENKSNYYNELITQYTEAGVEASNAVHNIEEYYDEIEELRAIQLPEEMYVMVKSDVEGLAMGILKSIDQLKGETHSLIDEYYNDKFYGKMIEVTKEIEWH